MGYLQLYILFYFITIFWTRASAIEKDDFTFLNASQNDQAHEEINNAAGHKRTSYTLELVVIVIISYWVLVARKYKYWNAKGVKNVTPKPFIGNMGQVLLGKQRLGQFLQSLYKEFPNEKYVGFYEGTRPSLLVRDPKLIQEILIKQFDKFKHRSAILAEGERILDNLTFGNEGTWDYWRKHLSPIFTSSNLKSYFPLIHTCGKNLSKVLSEESKRGEDVNIQFIVDQYTTQLSARCFLEMKHDTFDKPSWLMDITYDIMTPKIHTRLLFSVSRLFRRLPYYLKKLLNLNIVTENTKNFFIDVVRQYTSQHSLNLSPGGKTLLQKIADTKKNEELLRKFHMDEESLAAQVLIMFVGGFETSSRTTSFIIHELSKNQNIQDKLYEEISSIIKKHGEFSYDVLQEMKYLDLRTNNN